MNVWPPMYRTTVSPESAEPAQQEQTFCGNSNLIKRDLNVKSFVRIIVCRGRDRDSASSLGNLLLICVTPCWCNTHRMMLGREWNRRRRGVESISQNLHQPGLCLEFGDLIQCIDAQHQTQTELLICFHEWVMLISLQKFTELCLQLTYRGHN